MQTSTLGDDQHQHASPWCPGGTDLITSDGFKQMRLSSNPSLKWEIMTKQGEQSAVGSAEKQRLEPHLMCWKMGEEVQWDSGPQPFTIVDMWHRESWREGEEWGCVHTTELQQHRPSGILTLAFLANCYSFTLAQFPRALNLQSLCVRCVYYISGRAWAYHTSFEWQPVYWRQHTANVVC